MDEPMMLCLSGIALIVDYLAKHEKRETERRQKRKRRRVESSSEESPDEESTSDNQRKRRRESESSSETEEEPQQSLLLTSARELLTMAQERATMTINSAFCRYIACELDGMPPDEQRKLRRAIIRQLQEHETREDDEELEP